MKFKKIMATIMCTAAIATTLTGCGQTKKVEKVDKINVTYVKAPLNVPSIIEKDKMMFEDAFKEDNIEVAYHEITAGPDQTQALAAGELDFLHALGNTSALIAASQGVDLKILNVYSRGPKAFMLITNNPDIASPADLKGKKIAGPKGTVLHQLLITALESVNLTIDDVEFISMGIPEASAALSNKSIDVALLAGPAALKAKESGAIVVTTGEGLVDGTILTAVSGKFYEDHKEIVDKFLKVHEEALKMIGENPEDMLEIASQEVGLTLEQTKEMFSWYDFSSDITDEDIKSLEITQKFLIDNGLQEKPANIQDMLIK